LFIAGESMSASMAMLQQQPFLDDASRSV
jgi:hypothetical protein